MVREEALVTRKTVSILLTGVGAPGTRGTMYALRENADGTKVRIHGTDIKHDAIGRFWSDKFSTLPPPEDPTYLEEINRLCVEDGIDLVLPQTTRETVALSSARRKLKVPVAVSSASAVSVANDKSKLLAVFRRLGLPFPEFSVVRGMAELERKARLLGYPSVPVVVKPTVSYGSRGFRVLSESTSWDRNRFLTDKPSASEVTLDQLRATLARGSGAFPELLVTEYLPGIEYSVDAFIGKRAEVAIPRRRDEIVNGISFRTTVEHRDDVTRATLEAAKSIGLRFAFGFQFKLSQQGIPKVLECNPRVQGTMVASVFSGVNVIWMAVREALGDTSPVSVEETRTPTFTRFWGGLATLDGELAGEL